MEVEGVGGLESEGGGDRFTGKRVLGKNSD